MSDHGPAPDDVSSPAAGVKALSPVAADVGIVAALSIEVGFLIDGLKDVRRYAGPRHTVIEGECAGKIVALIVGGMGRKAARAAADTLFVGHRPRWIVSAGFGGALDPALARNAIVMPDEVVDPDGVRYAIDVSVPPQEGGAGVRTGRLLTVDQIIRTAAEKAELRRRTRADVLDMETSAVAAFCSERSLRFLAIRVVSDDAAEDLPPEVAALIARSGSYQVGAGLRAIWKRPSSLKDFWALRQRAQEAADRLARFTVAAIGRLPQ